jgi:hypothetical protein
MAVHLPMPSRQAVWWIVPLLMIVLCGGGVAVATLPARSVSTCADSLTVVAASSFAPVLSAVAPMVGEGADCARLDIVVADGRGAARQVADRAADVWIPDDASWGGTQGVAELAEPAPGGPGTVLATSPFYLVTDPATAARLTAEGGGWAGLGRLVASQAGIPPVTLALRDPASTGDGLLAAGAIGETKWIDAGMDASAELLAEAMPLTRTVTGPEPALPRSLGEVGVVPEHALLPALRSAEGADERQVLAPTDHTAVLRYSWFPTAAAAAQPATAGQLARLLSTLTGTSADRALADAGLRRPDATAPPGEPVPGLPAVTAPPFEVFLPHHADHVFTTWYAADRRADVLVAVDVSGSMNARVPGSDRRLIDLVKGGFADMGRLMPDDSELGLWEFGVRLDQSSDHRVLLPTAPLTAAHRRDLDVAVDQLEARSAGTGLHDTMLAAYLAARDRYRGVPSHVVVFTDGHNEEDPGSLSMEQLGQRLIEAQDPARPVRMTVVAFGAKPDAALLKKTLQPVNGYVGQVSTAEGVGRAFMHVAAGGLHD